MLIILIVAKKKLNHIKVNLVMEISSSNPLIHLASLQNSVIVRLHSIQLKYLTLQLKRIEDILELSSG